MRKLLLSICASVALVLGAPVAVLAQGSGTTPDQYEPVPASEGGDQTAGTIEDPDGPSQYVADAPISSNYQYASPADCGDSPCEVDEDVDDVVGDAAEDAAGSAEDVAGALDAAASYANGEYRPASATEIAEDPANDAPVTLRKTAGAGYDAGPPDEDETAPPARSAGRSGADGPEGEGRGSGGGGPDGAIMLDELPATGGTLSVPVALGAGVFLLLRVAGPLFRKIVR